MNTSTILALLGSGLLVVVLPQSTQACEPPAPGITVLNPDGGSHPGNAVVRISGYDLDINQVTVTIDDQPATAVPVDGPASSLAPIVFTIEPVPQPGQTVHLFGELCIGSDDCSLDATFTADEHDTEAPAAASNLDLNLHQYPEVDPGAGSCVSGSDFTYWIEFDHPEQGPHAMVVLFPEGEPDNVLTWRTISTTSTGLRTFEESFSGYDLSGICVRVTPFDLALHQGEASEICGLCNYREDTEVDDPWTNPAQPAWNDGDIWPGGPCDNSVETGTDTDTDTDTGTDSETDTDGGTTSGETGTTDPSTSDPTLAETTEDSLDSTVGPGSESDSATDSDTGLITDKGCGCRTSTPQTPFMMLAGLMGLWMFRRRQSPH